MQITVDNVKVFLLDIEGTTTSISFVKNILFPYVRQHLNEYLKKHWGEDSLMKTVEDLRKQVNDDKEKGIKDVVEIFDLPDVPSEEQIYDMQKSIVENVLWQMDEDRKTTALKKLQGQMWHNGYNDGQIKAHVYSDVPACLKKWKDSGKQIYIYSSGSIEAQKLLFGSTEHGNLLQYIDGHFDTTTGPKTEPVSYYKIAQTLGEQPKNILFLTDVSKEAEASVGAGIQTILVVRDGNAPISEEDKLIYTQIYTFEDICVS